MQSGQNRLVDLGWLVLALSLGALCILQSWAGLALRGLYADGAYYAAQLLLRQSFVIIEPSRFTSQLLLQAPVVLAMSLGLDSPRAVALGFSLASNLMPLTLTLTCFLVLPRADRAYGLFPLFVFLAFSMSAAFASVADGPTAAAYAWLLLLLILFGSLTPLRLGAILCLSVGALRLHEATVFLGPILAFACLWRGRETRGRGAKLALALAALLILAGTTFALHDVLHPRRIANRASFIQDVEALHWLTTGPGSISISALAGCLAVLALPAMWLRGRAWAIGMGSIALVFVVLLSLAAVMPASPGSAFAARNNACLMTAPAMLILFAQRRWPMTSGGPATGLVTCALLSLTVAAADVTATNGWLGYTQTMRQVLASHQGVVAWATALAPLPAAEAESLHRFAWPWTTPLMSLWLAADPGSLTMIANPPGIAWQPFDPYALQRQRADAPAVSGRDRFATAFGA